MEDLEIVALADTSYHGRENVIKVMKDIDKDRWGNGLTRCIYYSFENIIVVTDIDKDRWGNGITHCIYYSSENVINIMTDIDKGK